VEIGSKEKSETSSDEQRDYFFEQVRVPWGCPGYVVADHDTRLAAIVDPELEMVEPMIGLLFKHGPRPAYIIDTYTHADHVYGARDLKCKTIAKLVMHEEAPSGAIDIRVKDGDWIFASPVSRERPLKMALFGKNDVRHPRIGGRPSCATR
jgi:glyoxylase-like metal-dependent hydrolase (beta-lactamase superfamily II)